LVAVPAPDIAALKVPAGRRISVLGSTGSVGCNTLDLLSRMKDEIGIVALTAHRNVEALARQAIEFRAELAVIADETLYPVLKEKLAGSGVEAAAGAAAVAEAAALDADWVMASIVGAAGLAPTLAAVRRGATVALANKECLVCAGGIFLEEVARSNAVLLPVDSEHNAIFQVFDFERAASVERIILTASGGPFRSFTRAEMADVTPGQAVKHPNWSMGAKISVDSATMMNKGLELIEAAYLFPVPPERIDVLVHAQSVIHGMVQYSDGSLLAQMGSPDMRTPIAFTLGWPERTKAPAQRLDLARIGQLTFEAPDPVRFPALRLAREALQCGGTAPTLLNAANEVAVESFLKGRIGFLDIAAVVERTLAEDTFAALTSLEDVMGADRLGRRLARQFVEKAAGRQGE